MNKEIQNMIDSNQFVSGKANKETLVEGKSRILFISPQAKQHVLSRHQDKYAPGSLFHATTDFNTLIKKFIDTKPDEVAKNGFVKWFGRDVGTTIGSMGVAKTNPETVSKMKDYTMPDSRRPEVVKIAAGLRKPTSELSIIAAPIGKISDGRQVLTLITMFPGGIEIGGTVMPSNRNDFASVGFYFVMPEDSPML